jgi:uncharacterized protein (DUF3084 family)
MSQIRETRRVLDFSSSNISESEYWKSHFGWAQGFKAQSSKLKAQSSKLKAQSSKLKVQSSKLKAQSSKLKVSKLKVSISKLKAHSPNLFLFLCEPFWLGSRALSLKSLSLV